MASAAFSIEHYQRNGKLKATYLAAQIPKDLERFNEAPFACSFVINPPQRMLPSIYSSCDVWFSPSINEGFGLTSLEAMACGTPVVMCRNRGLDQYVKSGENCLLVKDSQEMAEAAHSILGSPKLQAELIAGGKVLSSRFVWNNTFDKFYTALRTIGVVP